MALTEKLTAIADAIRSQSGKAEKLTLDQMSVEIINLQSLSFAVVGNPQPAAPGENTLWIDTDEPITGWIFSAEAPEAPEEGQVWIATGKSGTVEFNALKENAIMVCPLSAKQYVGGAWVSVAAKSYQNGAWAEWLVWNGELYDRGNEYESVTGGWYAANDGSLEASTIASLTRNETSMLLTVTGTRKSAMLITPNPVDLTGFSLLTFEGLVHPGTAATDKAAYGFLYAYKNVDGTLTRVARADIKSGKTAQTFTLDVSGLSGAHYVAVYFDTFDSTSPYLEMYSLLLS